MDNGLSSLTIAEAHKKLKNKECSSADLVQACIDRIESVDKHLNAIVYKNFEGALDQAKKVDKAGTFDDALTGIPFLTKDVFCEVGVPTTACSNVLRNKDYKPPFESTTTDRLKKRGAISIAKVNTDEFTMGASTETSCYGVTKNPWDTSRVAGGSSGGSAAGVSASEGIFALGTDTGGSIRQPSSFCNCSGLRVTYGRTSRYGAMSMASSLDTIGPICKSAEDIAIVMNAIAGKDPLDATTSDRNVPDYVKELGAGVHGKTIGIPKEYFIEGIDPDTEKAVRGAAKLYESLGATLVDISLPHTKYAIATYYIIVPSEVSSNMARYDGIRFGHTVKSPDDLIEYYKTVRSEGFGAEVKRRIMIGTYALSAGYFDAYYMQAQKVRTLIKNDFDEAYKKVDLILSPVAPSTAFKIGAHADDPVSMYLEDIFLAASPLAGIPALSIPCGFSKDNLPIGLQLMAKQWDEAALLAAAHAYQQETDFHTKKPDIN